MQEKRDNSALSHDGHLLGPSVDLISTDTAATGCHSYLHMPVVAPRTAPGVSDEPVGDSLCVSGAVFVPFVVLDAPADHQDGVINRFVTARVGDNATLVTLPDGSAAVNSDNHGTM